MIVLLVSLVALVGFMVLLKMRISEGWDALGLSGALVTSLWLLTLGITIPISRSEGYDKLARLKAFRESVQRARVDKSLSDVERAAILSQIATWNEWLASERYWKGTCWSLWHVDEVMTTEDLK